MNPARFLLINTCGEEAVIALGSEAAEGNANVIADVIAEERTSGRTASEWLLGAIRRVLGGVSVQDLAGVGVVTGPGSFTGVRVGLSAAKGLCEAAGIGAIGLSRLDLLAGGGEIAILDAGRGEYFVSGDRLLREPPPGTLITCEARVVEKLGSGVRLVREPGGEEMLQAVLARVRAGAWDDVSTMDASYLRRTDAELAVERAASTASSAG